MTERRYRIVLYRIWCKFEPNHINPMTGRHGQWRVMRALPYENSWLVPDICVIGNELCLPSTKPYPRGCIIRPHKELNRVFAQQRSHSQFVHWYLSLINSEVPA